MGAKISVIVPVYKTEKTLTECIESLLRQTVCKIEIILVEDGSPDACPRICDECAMNYSNIWVIHQKNGGLSSARNTGLRIASGEYIGFVDSDDYVSPEMFEKMLHRIEEAQSDICICAHYTVNEVGETTEHFFTSIPEYLEKQEILSYLVLPLIGCGTDENEERIEGFVWRNLYRKELMSQYAFLSERTYFAEDVLSDIELYPKCSSISIVNECLYYYRFNSDSLSNKYRPQVYVLLNNLLRKEKEFLIRESLFETEKNRLYNTGIKFLVFSIHNIKKGNLGIINEVREIHNAFKQNMLMESVQNVELKNKSLKMKCFLVFARLLCCA